MRLVIEQSLLSLCHLQIETKTLEEVKEVVSYASTRRIMLGNMVVPL